MHATLDRAASAGAAPAFCFHTELKASLPKLRRYGLMLTRNRAAMEDLVQDSVVRALAAEAGFTPGSNFAAWISCILRNEFISGLRRNRLFTACDPLVIEKIAVSPRQEDHLVLRELVGAIDRLPPMQREALLLATVNGLNHAEIAETMHCRAGTVKSRIGRARLQLERDLTEIAPAMPGGPAAGAGQAPRRNRARCGCSRRVPCLARRHPAGRPRLRRRGRTPVRGGVT